MTIDEIKALCRHMAESPGCARSSTGTLARCLLAAIEEAERYRPYTLDEYACGERATIAAILTAITEAAS